MSAATLFLKGQILIQYGISPHKQPHPVSDHLGFTLWVVAYGKFDCSLVMIIFDTESFQILLGGCEQGFVTFYFAFFQFFLAHNITERFCYSKHLVFL